MNKSGALSRKSENADAVIDVDRRGSVPRVGDLPEVLIRGNGDVDSSRGVGFLAIKAAPAALIWENVDVNGWRLACFNGEHHGSSHGGFGELGKARSAASRLGYTERMQLVYPMIGGPSRKLADYSGVIRCTLWDDVGSYSKDRELRSSYLVTARSDDEAIAAALAECYDYWDELAELDPRHNCPLTCAEIVAEQPDGRVDTIYARPGIPGLPAVAYYDCSESDYSRAEVYSEVPDPTGVQWAAVYWTRKNGGEPPPVVIRSWNGLHARIRDFRGDNTRVAGLSL